MVAITVPVRKQEHQWERERSDKRSDPPPISEAASATLGNQTDEVDRNNESDQGNDIHGARSNAALR